MAERRQISLLTLILTVGAVAVVPLSVLFWVGWRLRERELVLASQQIGQRVERAADIVTASLMRPITASRQRLQASAANWPSGAVVVEIAASRFSAWPRGRLAWVAEPPPLEEIAPATIAEGEDLEFRKGDLVAAEAFYRRLFRSTDPAIRAAAGVRLARVLRARRDSTGALAVYTMMDRLDGSGLEGVPAALVAAHARTELLIEIGRPEESRSETAKLRQDLVSGRWLLRRPVYMLYAGETGSEAEGLAKVAAQLHQQWKVRPLDATGLTVTADGKHYTVLLHPTGDGVRALLVTPQFVDTHWLPAAKETAAAQNVRLSIGSEAPGSYGAVRKPADTSLPWTIQVTSLDPSAELAELTGRQRLLDSGFVLLAIFTLAAAAIAIRALRREWAVSRLQSEFVSAVSHEFRTPLTSLRQFTEMLRDGRELSETRRRLCYEAQARAADRLTRLVESLLDFSRLESGTRTYRLQPCEAGSLVRQVVRDFNAEINSSGRQVELSESGAGIVDADAEAFGLALWNLLDNAFKYSPGEKTVNVVVDRRSGHVAIQVRDRGIGIPQAEQGLIFRRFRRGTQAGLLGIKGTGIGLALVNHIVKAHQGTMELESEPGKGSCFTVLLPVKE